MTDKRHRKPKPNANPEPEIAWTYSFRLTPGEYPAYCRHAKVYRDAQFKRWVCAAQFDILDAQQARTIAQITWYLNLGDGPQPHAGRRRHYWRAWVFANGKQPQRNDRLSARVFQRRHALVLVGNTAKDFESKPVTAESGYSVIRKVLRWETGRKPE